MLRLGVSRLMPGLPHRTQARPTGKLRCRRLKHVFNHVFNYSNAYAWFMHACMFVCMYVRMYVCMYACMYLCMHACMHCMHACMDACMHASMNGWMYGCMHACLYAYADMFRAVLPVPRRSDPTCRAHGRTHSMQPARHCSCRRLASPHLPRSV